MAVFGQDHEKIKYSGTVITQNTEYPPIVQEIQSYVESNLGVKFNHCMVRHALFVHSIYAKPTRTDSSTAMLMDQ